MNEARRLLEWLLFHPRKDESRLAVIGWWETRRIAYNLLVGTSGILAVLAFTAPVILTESATGFVSTLDPSIVIFIAVYGLTANLFYTSGWVFELVVSWFLQRDIAVFGQATFAVGTLFSMALTLLPSVLIGGLILLRMVLQP